MQTFTLVPVGGLGNRIMAISSSLAFCQTKGRRLTIIWFKDSGLNCDYDKLFYIDPSIKNVKIRNAKGLDFLLNDNPRRRNFWIPKIIQKMYFGICLYYQNLDNTLIEKTYPYNRKLDAFSSIYMVSCGVYWENKDMYKWLIPQAKIKIKVDEITSRFNRNTIGIHIRRTDNIDCIRLCPTNLYISAIKEELEKDNETLFFVATDSVDEELTLTNLFGDKIITIPKVLNRDTQEGVIDAFIDMNILGRTKKIIGSGSSFALVSSYLSSTEIIAVENKQY